MLRRKEKLDSESDGLTQADIDKATRTLEAFYPSRAPKTGTDQPATPKFKDDGKTLTLRMEPVPESPVKKIREGKPIKIKTVFHAIELNLQDRNGGTFKCEYYMRETANKITDGLSKLYPAYSKAQIENQAKLLGKDYEETKAIIALNIAHQIFLMRIQIAKFFHDQLESTLNVVLDDLIVDAELFGFTKYGYQIANASEFGKTHKEYSKMRRTRVEIIKGKGRPKGSISIDEAEFFQFLERSMDYLKELDMTNHRLTKHALARKLYPQNSNPLQQLSRFLKRYEISFENVIADYEATKK